MKQWILSLIALAAILFASAISGCATGTSSVAGTPADADLTGVNYSLVVTGGTSSPLTLTYADLKSLGLARKSNITYIDDAGLDVQGDFVGVPMDSFLQKVGLPPGNFTYNVSAADGESAVYTQKQADRAILALKKDGVALTGDPSNDPIRMVLPGGPYCHWIVLPARIDIVPDN